MSTTSVTFNLHSSAKLVCDNLVSTKQQIFQANFFCFYKLTFFSSLIRSSCLSELLKFTFIIRLWMSVWFQIEQRTRTCLCTIFIIHFGWDSERSCEIACMIKSLAWKIYQIRMIVLLISCICYEMMQFIMMNCQCVCVRALVNSCEISLSFLWTFVFATQFEKTNALSFSHMMTFVICL